MTISFPCPSCGQTLKAPPQAAGKNARCPNCQQVAQIPAPAAPSAPPAQADLADFFSENLPETPHPGVDPVQQQAESFPGYVPGHAPPVEANPYEPPTATRPPSALASAAAGGNDSVRDVARGRKMLIVAVLISIITSISLFAVVFLLRFMEIGFNTGTSIAVLSTCLVVGIGLIVFTLFCVYSLTEKLEGSGTAVLYVVLWLFIPFAALIILIMLIQKSSAYIRENS